uniref:SH2 domain-containing protein n=1 Tax=Parastrongyloides trichosuri TaxID=131310 RepID=A0A0N4ZYQ9_PARTI
MSSNIISKMIKPLDKLYSTKNDLLDDNSEMERTNELIYQPWYHGLIKRVEAEKLLKENGDFLVRDSISKDGEYVLTVKWMSKPMHFQINCEKINDKVYYRFEDEQFPSIPDLINFFRIHKRKVTLLSGCIISNPIISQMISNNLSNDNYITSEIEANYARLFNPSTTPRLTETNRNLSQQVMLNHAKKYLNKSETNLNTLLTTKEKFNNNFKSISNIKLNTIFSIQPQKSNTIPLSLINEKEDEQDYCDLDYDSMENFSSPVHIKRLSTTSQDDNLLPNLNKNFSNSVHDLQFNLGDGRDNHFHDTPTVGKTRSFSNLRFMVNTTTTRPVSISSTSSSSTSTSLSNGSHNLSGSINKNSKLSLQPRSISRISMGKTAASLIAEKKKDLVPSLPRRPSEDNNIKENDSICELLKIEKELKQSIISLNNLSLTNNDRDSACVLDTSNEGDYDCLPIKNKCGSLSPDSGITNESDESEAETFSSTNDSISNTFCNRLISMNINSICRMITEEDVKLLKLHLDKENEIASLLLPFGSIIRQECAERSSILTEVVLKTLDTSNNVKLILSVWTRVASSLIHDYGNLFSFASIYIGLQQFYNNPNSKINSDDSSLKLIKSLLTPLFEELKSTGEIHYNNNTGTTMVPYIQPLIQIFNNESLRCYESSYTTSFDKSFLDKQLDYMWNWLTIGRRWSQNADIFVNKAKNFYKPENESKHNIFEISHLRSLLNCINKTNENKYGMHNVNNYQSLDKNNKMEKILVDIC